jgi:hypothetical protein
MGISIFFLLQTRELSEFKIQPKPIHGVIFLIGVAVVVFVMIYLNKSKKIKNSTIFKSGAVETPQMTTHIALPKGLRDAAGKYGLDNEEMRFLAVLCDKAKIDITRVFDSVETIDTEFSQVIRMLSREDNAAENTAKLFTIRNKIEYYLSAEKNAQGSSGKAPHRYKRVSVGIPVAFYVVIVTETRQGFKTVRKLSLADEKFLGNFLDISAGGCAIESEKCQGVKIGTRIKIDFKLGKSDYAALGQVVSIEKRRSGIVLHTRFLKASEKSLNAINTFVFNYRDI